MNKFLIFVFLLISFLSLATEEQKKALLKKAKSAITEQEIINTSIELTAFYESYDYLKWQASVLELKEKYKKTENKKQKFRITISLAKNAIAAGKQVEFQQYFKTLISEKKYVDNSTLIDFNHLQIKSLILAGNYEQAKKLANQNLFIAQQTRKNRFVSESYATLAEIYSLQNNMDSAYVCGSYSISFAKRSDSKQRLFQSLHEQAVIFAYFENYEAAVNKELQVLQMAESDDNLYYQVVAFQSIALYSLEIKNLEVALIYLMRAKDLNLKLKDQRISGTNTLIEAGIYVNRKQFVEATNTINKAEKVYKTNKDYKNLGNIQLTKGIIALKLNSFQNSLTAFELASTYFTRSGNLLNQNLVNQFLGEVYLLKNELISSEKYLKIALVENEKRGLKSVKIQTIYKLLSQLYFKKNDLQKAVKYQFLYIDCLEKSTILNSAAIVARMTEGNLREERERLIEFQKESIERKKKEEEIKSLQLSRQLFISGIISGLIIVAFIFYILRLRQEKLKQKQREMELSQSLLRTQMNPHFIFNAMSVIQSYIYANDPDKSSQFLVNFSRLIRLILENSPKEFIPIELEVEILEKYLQAQKMRFDNRFSYSIEVDDNLLNVSAMVPPMITQPFVENAIEHGQLHTIKGGHITISISEKDTMIQIQITDNGVGRKGAQKTKKIKSHKSMAINITKERIEIINFKYKKQGSILIEDFNKEKQTGTIVAILLPLYIDKL
jgi:hypothetical protein